VVQLTSIRLPYIDVILDAYQTQYAGTVPVVMWSVHSYVLREGAIGQGRGSATKSSASIGSRRRTTR
jgi:hypothetical protein